MDELRAKYEKQLKDYDTLVKTALQTEDISQVPKLRMMNIEISRTLNEMIEKLTFMKKETPNIKTQREELLGRLREIQKDYNGLRADTDTLETLRRIRQQESAEADKQLYTMFGFFLLVCLIIVLYLAFVPHRKDTTAASARMPPTTAAFV